MHHSANSALCSLVLLRQTPRPATFDGPSAPPMDAFHKTHLQVLRIQLLNQIQAQRSLVDDQSKTAQNRNKQDYDTNFCRIQKFTLRQIVFDDRTPIAAASAIAEKLALFSYNKLMPRTFEPFHVVCVTLQTLTTDGNGFHNMLTINFASSALNQPKRNSTEQHKTDKDSFATNLKVTDRVSPDRPKSMPSTT